MNKLFIDNESYNIEEDNITISQIKRKANSIEVGGNVQGDIDANSVKVKGRHTGSINV